MKKKLLIITILFLMLPIMKVSATGISASPSNVSIYKGNSQNITVTVTNLAARLDITTSNSSVASISRSTLDLTSNGPGSVSGSFTITGNNTGSATVTIKTYDASNFTEGNDYNQTLTIRVTVNNPTTQTPVTQPQNTEPHTQAPTQPQTRPTQPQQQEEPTTQAETTTAESTTTSMIDSNSNGIDDEIEFSSLKIVGFPIEFDPKVNTYSINIGEVKALYVKATALTEGATIDSNGEVDVEGIDSLTLTLKYNDKSSTMIINLNRNSKEETVSPKTDTTSNSKLAAVLISFLFFTTSISIAAFVYKEQLVNMFSKKETAGIVEEQQKIETSIFDNINDKKE